MSNPYDSIDGDEQEEEDTGNSRGHQFIGDVRETSAFGRIVVKPSNHFQRIFALFDQGQRVRFVEYAYNESISAAPSSPSLRQFIYEILSSDPDPPEELEADLNFWPGSDSERDSAIRKYHKNMTDSVLRGDDYRGLAKLLVNTLFLESELVDAAEFDRFFARALGSAILLPQQAAAVATCVAESRADFNRFEKEADFLLNDAHIVRRESFDKDVTYRIARERISELDDIYKIFGVERPRIAQHQTEIVRPDDLIDRFKLRIVAEGLTLPARKGIVIAKTLEEAIRMAETDKSSLLSMEPRRFEEFMAALFERLGFQVELTQATRDGGADLLCLRDLNGIPFRFAVEIKRYKESRPIDVSLVRAFVGANEEQRANQLVYVTTSSYTKPAIQFAKQCRPYFLNLKKYDQIQEWCREALSDNSTLM